MDKKLKKKTRKIYRKRIPKLEVEKLQRYQKILNEATDLQYMWGRITAKALSHQQLAEKYARILEIFKISSGVYSKSGDEKAWVEKCLKEMEAEHLLSRHFKELNNPDRFSKMISYCRIRLKHLLRQLAPNRVLSPEKK